MKYLLLLIILVNISIVSAEISYEITWDKGDIVNGEEFEIVVKVLVNSGEKYDGKLWIESDGDIISDRYDPESDSWKSSYYYLNSYFEDGEEKEVLLRIDEDYIDFEGMALIHFRLRGEEEIVEEIVIIRNEESVDKNVEVAETIEEENEETVANEEDFVEELFVESNPIHLGNKMDTLEEKDINTFEPVYESKSIKITEYSVYGFALLCVLICVLIIWRKFD